MSIDKDSISLVVMDFTNDVYDEELQQWLVQHIQSMNTVTAMFFKIGLSPCLGH